MRHTGMLFLNRQRPSAGHAKCGTFQLQLSAYDRQDQHQTELWYLTWTGPAAQRFWQRHEADLKPGAVIKVELEKARTHTLYTRPPQSFIRARVISMEFVPRVQPAKSAKAELQPA